MKPAPGRVPHVTDHHTDLCGYICEVQPLHPLVIYVDDHVMGVKSVSVGVSLQHNITDGLQRKI